uniref:Methylguanine DNA methyltransferase ribonuclease-like domain-containing protein n=1 Tax=Mola mola TaxID=94237 RepID=A0A3Q3W556_MOLML
LEQKNMKKQRESQCTQKTISLLSPLGTIQVSGCENGVHTIQILMDVAPAVRSGEAPLSCVVNDSPAETSPELQRCVEWLQAYFSEPQTRIGECVRTGGLCMIVCMRALAFTTPPPQKNTRRRHELKRCIFLSH